MTDTFAIATPHARPYLLLLLGTLVFAILLFSVMLLGGAWYGSRHGRFEISPDGLRLRGDIYGRLIPASALLPEQARVLDVRATPEFRPRGRTFGTALPGYSAGWFRLANGDKALLMVTDWSKVVYVPTRAGYAVLISPAAPEAALRALQALGRASP